MMSKNPTSRALKTVAMNLEGTADLKETVAADLETMVIKGRTWAVEIPNKQTRMWIRKADILLRTVAMTLTVGGRQSIIYLIVVQV